MDWEDFEKEAENLLLEIDRLHRQLPVEMVVSPVTGQTYESVPAREFFQLLDVCSNIEELEETFPAVREAVREVVEHLEGLSYH